MKEKFRIILITIIGILFTYILYSSYHFDNLFRLFFYLILGSIGFYLMLFTFIKDKEKYTTNKSLKNFLPSLYNMFYVILNLSIFYYYEYKLNLPTLLKAENHGLYACFKQNGDYIIKSGSWASKTHFYGSYKINDTIIILDKSNFDDVLSTNKLVIRKVKNNNKIQFMLFQIDKKGKEIIEKDSFEITEDNRINK